MNGFDRLCTQLQQFGACEVPIRFSRHHGDTQQAVAAARSRAYRAAKKVGVRVTTLAGWDVVYAKVVRP